MGNDPDIAYSCTSQDLYNHTPQSLDYPTSAESLHMPKGNLYTFNNTGRKYKNQFNDHQHEIMKEDYYTHNQDKMNHSFSKVVFYNRIKVHYTLTIGIKCSLPKKLRNGDFIAKLFCPIINYLPLNFVLKFKKGKSFLKISNPSSKSLTVKADTALGSVSFKLVRNLSQCTNTVTHLHEDLNGSIAISSLKMSECPNYQSMGNDPDIAHSCTSQDLYNHTPQSLDLSYLCRKSAHA